MLKIFITGAAGCLGRRVIKQLQQQQVEIFATDIRPDCFTGQNNIQYQAHDVRQDSVYQWLEQVKPHVILHLASILQISAQMPREEAFKIDVLATERLLETAANTGCEKFIVTTSGAGYGYHKKNIDAWITEDWPSDGNQDYFYSAHKAAVEKLMAKYAQQHPELKQVVFRPGTILGPEFDGPVVNLFQQKVITGVLGYQGAFNFVWSEDVVAYIQEAIFTDVEGAYNLAGDGALTMRQIAKELDKPYLPLPSWLIKGVLSIIKPLGLSQYGPEQVKFVMYRPVLANDKVKSNFKHQPQYSTIESLRTFLTLTAEQSS